MIGSETEDRLSYHFLKINKKGKENKGIIPKTFFTAAKKSAINNTVLCDLLKIAGDPPLAELLKDAGLADFS